MADRWDKYFIQEDEDKKAIPQRPSPKPSADRWDKFFVEKVEKEPAPQDIYTLPDILGGGSFRGKSSLTPEELEPVRSKREDLSSAEIKEFRGGTFEDLQTEVDHKISLALGGTNKEDNLQNLSSDKSLVDSLLQTMGIQEKAAHRQEGKYLVEVEAIDKFRSGEISLAEARGAVVNWENPEPFLHKEEKKGKYLAPELKKSFTELLSGVPSGLFGPVGKLVADTTRLINSEFGDDDGPDTSVITQENEDVGGMPDQGPDTSVITQENEDVGGMPDQGPDTSVMEQASTEFQDDSVWGKTKEFVNAAGDWLSKFKEQVFDTPLTEEAGLFPGGLLNIQTEGGEEMRKSIRKELTETGVQVMRGVDFLTNYMKPGYWMFQKQVRDRAYDEMDAKLAEIRPAEGFEEAFQAGEFIGEAIPYILGDVAIVKYLNTLPKAIATSKVVKQLAEVTSWVGVGQVIHRKEDGARADRAIMDFGGYVGFSALGFVGKALIKGLRMVFQPGQKAIVETLSEASQEIVERAKTGEKVSVDELEYVVKEMEKNPVPGTATLDEVKITTNNAAQLENLTPNTYKTHYSVDPKLTDVKFDFKPGRVLRVTAPDAKSLSKVAGDIGERLPVKTSRNIADNFGYRVSDYNALKDDFERSLTALAVKSTKGTRTAGSIIQEVDKLSNQINKELNALIKSFKGRSGNPIKEYARAVDFATRLPEEVRKRGAGTFADYVQTAIKADKELAQEIEKATIKPGAKKFVEKVEEVPKPKVKAKEKLKPGEAEIKVEGVPIQPVKQDIKGKKKVKSKLEARVEKAISDDFEIRGEKHTQMDLAENVRRNTELVEKKSSQEVLDIVKGFEKQPAGSTDVGAGMALFQKALLEGDVKLASEAWTATKRRATRLGQEIVSLRGNIKIDSPEQLLNEVFKRKVKAAGIAEKKILKGELVGSAEAIAQKRVKSEADAIRTAVKKDIGKIKSAQNILDSLTCK